MLSCSGYATVLSTPSSPNIMILVELAHPPFLSDCQTIPRVSKRYSLIGLIRSNSDRVIAATEGLAMLSQLLYADALVFLIPFYYRRRKQHASFSHALRSYSHAFARYARSAGSVSGAGAYRLDGFPRTGRL